MIYTPETLPDVLEIRVDEQDIAKGGTWCRECPVYHALEKCYPLEYPYEWAVARHVIHFSNANNWNICDYILPEEVRDFILKNDLGIEVEPLSFVAKQIK